MSKHRLFGLCSLFGLALLVACSKEEAMIGSLEPEPEVEETRSYPQSEASLWPYFQRFEEEAAKRGLIIDLNTSGIEGVIEEIHEDNVLGQCSYSPRFPDQLTIDKSFWDRASDRYREFVVFHELGHCELVRGHFEGSFSDGTCMSLMRSGLEDCRDNYRESTRDLYLDELFDPNKQGDWFDQ